MLILSTGIKKVLFETKTKKEFLPFESILSHLEKNKQSNSNVNHISSSLNQVFSIENLICNNIFEYLDLKSLVGSCSLVNSYWLHQSYKLSSIYQFNTSDIFWRVSGINHIKRRNRRPTYTYRYHERFKDLSRFQNAHELFVHDRMNGAGYSVEQIKYNSYNQLQLFGKVTKMNILFTNTNPLIVDRTKAIRQCIFNNLDNMSSLSVYLHRASRGKERLFGYI